MRKLISHNVQHVGFQIGHYLKKNVTPLRTIIEMPDLLLLCAYLHLPPYVLCFLCNLTSSDIPWVLKSNLRNLPEVQSVN